MLSGWGTQDTLACPYCMDNTKAFILRYGGKVLGSIVIIDFYQWIILLKKLKRDLQKTRLRKKDHLTCLQVMISRKLFVIFQKSQIVSEPPNFHDLGNNIIGLYEVYIGIFHT